MRSIDVFGPPGVGKSTICDHLWHPHAIPWQTVKTFPDEWDDYLACVEGLLAKVQHHESFQACLGMVNRSIRKMAAVQAKDDERIYIQTGFAQRGLGFGWRLDDPEAVRRYYELMPVSLGVVSLWAPTDVVVARNRSPERVRSNENRAHMVPLMERPREIALEVMKARGVALLELDTRRSPQELRNELLEFRDRQSAKAVHASKAGPDHKAAAVSGLA